MALTIMQNHHTLDCSTVAASKIRAEGLLLNQQSVLVSFPRCTKCTLFHQTSFLHWTESVMLVLRLVLFLISAVNVLGDPRINLFRLK